MSVIEDLKTAMATIDKGWYQGGLVGAEGVCAVGALNMACAGSPVPWGDVDWARRDESYKALKSHLPKDFQGREIAYFNDHPGTTKQDVLNLFEKTLADLGGLGT